MTDVKRPAVVFVTQEPRPSLKHNWMPDLSSAAMYGPIQYVFTGEDRLRYLPGPAWTKAKEVMSKFRFDIDYFLWPKDTDHLALYFCLVALAQRGMTELKILRWQRSFTREDEDRPRAVGAFVPMTLFFN